MTDETFTIDVTEIHTLIVNFTTGNKTSETNIQRNTNIYNGHLDHLYPCNHFKLVGVLGIYTNKSDKIL